MRMNAPAIKSTEEKLVSNFKRIASETNDPKLLADSKRIEKYFKESEKRVQSSEKETLITKEEKKKRREKKKKKPVRTTCFVFFFLIVSDFV